MRTALFLAIALLAVPATAQQREPAITPPAPSVPAEADQSTRTRERQSLMGAVMGLLIRSAEQASADQASSRHSAQGPKVGVDRFNAPDAPALEPPAPETPAREAREVAVHSGSPGTP